MPEPAPALVTLHVWRVRARSLPRLLARARRLPAPGARFAKLLGTSSGFTARTVDLRRWAVLAAWDAADAAESFDRDNPWDAFARERARLVLRPLSSRGRWAGREPFGTLGAGAPGAAALPCDQPVAVLTRARLSPLRARAFWRAVPPVEAAVAPAAGLRLALGLGEAPVGWQGTFSVWESPAAMRDFARGPAHADVVARTHREAWYAEELFARFALVTASGTIGGANLLP